MIEKICFDPYAHDIDEMISLFLFKPNMKFYHVELVYQKLLLDKGDFA